MAIVGPSGICYHSISGPSGISGGSYWTPENIIWVQPKLSGMYYIRYGVTGGPSGYINRTMIRASSLEPLVINNNNPLITINTKTSPYYEYTLGGSISAGLSPCGIATGNFLFKGDKLTFSGIINTSSGYFLKNPNNYTKITSDNSATQLNKWYYNTQNKKIIYKTEVTNLNNNVYVTFPPLGQLMKVHCNSNASYPTDNFHLVFRISHNGTTEDVVWFNVISGEKSFEFECDEDSRITIFNFQPSGWPTAAWTAMPSNYMGNIYGSISEVFRWDDLNPSVTGGYQTSPITGETWIQMHNS